MRSNLDDLGPELESMRELYRNYPTLFTFFMNSLLLMLILTSNVALECLLWEEDR